MLHLYLPVFPSRCISCSYCCSVPGSLTTSSLSCSLTSGWIWSIGGTTRRSEGGRREKSGCFFPLLCPLHSPWVSSVSLPGSRLPAGGPLHTIPSPGSLLPLGLLHCPLLISRNSAFWVRVPCLPHPPGRPPTPAPVCLQQCCVYRNAVRRFIENIFLLKNN